MSVLDTLLTIDNNKLSIANEMVKIVRLSNMAGEDVIFEIKPLSTKEISEFSKLDDADILIHALYKAIVSPNMSDERLLKKYECITPKELIKKILLPTEISGLYSAFNKIMGFGEENDNDENATAEVEE